MFYDGKYSVLSLLLVIRGRVPSKILPQLDDLILFVIDKMVTDNIEVVGSELSWGCEWDATVPVNCAIVRKLLAAGKYDVNGGNANYYSPPFFMLIGSLKCDDSIPSALLDCIHLLLNTKEFDINRLWMRKANGTVQQEHVLQYVYHPEIAKELLRNGLKINSVTTFASGRTGNALLFAILRPQNPRLEELVRLYMGHGVLLVADGRDKKSSFVMSKIFTGVVDQKTETQVHVSEDVLHLYLHLNNKQQLLMRWQSPDSTNDDWTFLHSAVRYSPPRFVEIIYAHNRDAMNEPSVAGGIRISVVAALSERIQNVKAADEFETCMKVLEVLLDDAKLDLLEIDKYDAMKSSRFAILWNAARDAKQALNLLKKTIVAKRGQGEFKRCLDTLEKYFFR